MPKPSSGESEDDFVSRCIPIVIREGTAKDGAQGAAICHSIYSEHGKSYWQVFLDAVSGKGWKKPPKKPY